MSRRSTVGSMDSASIAAAAPSREKQSPPAVAAQEPAPATIPPREEWAVEESLVPMFDNDHLLWMLESHLEAADAKQQQPLADGGSPDGGARVTGSKEELIDTLIGESKADTVEGVEAEDWPDLADSALNEQELCRSLK